MKKTIVHDLIRHRAALASVGVMTIFDVRLWVQKIFDLAHSGENVEAHREEDRLYHEVLSAISNGKTTDPRACADEALKTETINFDRWYS